jgi:hypothetical protein
MASSTNLPYTTAITNGYSTSPGGAPDAAGILETDLLIVGAGPAGASLACFLTQHGTRKPVSPQFPLLTVGTGLKGIMLSGAPSTADTPRAHIANMAALECLRDLGLEEQCKRAAVQGNCMRHTRWCRSMAGEEFARIYSWGNDPQRAVSLKSNLAQRSSAEYVD